VAKVLSTPESTKDENSAEVIFCFFGRASVILQPALEDGVTHQVDATRKVELAHRVGFMDLMVLTLKERRAAISLLL